MLQTSVASTLVLGEMTEVWGSEESINNRRNLLLGGIWILGQNFLKLSASGDEWGPRTLWIILPYTVCPSPASLSFLSSECMYSSGKNTSQPFWSELMVNSQASWGSEDGGHDIESHYCYDSYTIILRATYQNSFIISFNVCCKNCRHTLFFFCFVILHKEIFLSQDFWGSVTYWLWIWLRALEPNFLGLSYSASWLYDLISSLNLSMPSFPHLQKWLTIGIPSS